MDFLLKPFHNKIYMILSEFIHISWVYILIVRVPQGCKENWMLTCKKFLDPWVVALQSPLIIIIWELSWLLRKYIRLPVPVTHSLNSELPPTPNWIPRKTTNLNTHWFLTDGLEENDLFIITKTPIEKEMVMQHK